MKLLVYYEITFFYLGNIQVWQQAYIKKKKQEIQSMYYVNQNFATDTFK